MSLPLLADTADDMSSTRGNVVFLVLNGRGQLTRGGTLSGPGDKKTA